jgi:diguanylate cyclase (GGDEF)-like protein/PAS domain S-box-containing protein
MKLGLLEATVRLMLADRFPVLSADDGIEGLLGFKAAEFLSGNIQLRDLVHPQDREVAESLFSATKPQQFGSLVLRLRQSNGRIRVVEVEFQRERAGGENEILILHLRDAGRLSLNGEAQAAAGCWETLDILEDYLYFTDRNHVLVGANRLMREFVAAQLGEGTGWRGLSDYDVFPELYADVLYGMETEVLAGAPSVQQIHEIEVADGSHRWFDIRRYPLKNKSDKIIGLFGISRDVTEQVRLQQTLRESEEFLQESQRIAGIGSYTLDLVSGVWSSSEVLDGIFGIDKNHDHTVSSWGAMILDDDREWMERYFAEEVVGKGQTFDREYRIARQSDHAERWVHGLGHLERDTAGRAVKMRGTIQDITERKLTEEQLRFAASVFTHAREGIVITSPDGTILDVNGMFSTITGYAREEALGKKPNMLKSGRQDAGFYAQMWKLLVETGQWSGEIWNRCKDGRIYPEMLTISAVCDDRGRIRHYVALFMDITEMKEHERQLERLAHYDMLTGLPNRVLLLRRLQEAMSQLRRQDHCMAVAYLDLDGFKEVNDLHGHDIGDQLLIALSKRMQRVLRRGDTLARLGGDEFVLVAHDLESDAAGLSVLKQLLTTASDPVLIGVEVLQVSASIGVTFYPQVEALEADQLLRQADHAMYQAKMAGKNRYEIFDGRKGATNQGQKQLVEQIRRALDEQEFVMYYQPKVNMGTGEIIGAEALIRWQHPERGLLSPAVFLPAIEDNVLAVEVGDWVISTVLDQMEEWKRADLELPVSVNVGARQLQQEDFADRLKRHLDEHPGVDPHKLELEIQNSGSAGNSQQMHTLIAGCRALGVTFALDDFGTGSNSLHDLKRSPTDVLKIDPSFVRDIFENPREMSILESVLGLASAYSRQSIAEGVENVEQGLSLLRMGCELAQGYGIAPPMPAEELPDWMLKWRPDPRWLDVVVESAVPVAGPLEDAPEEHRAWLAQMEAYLKGESNSEPRVSRHQCKLGAWLDAESLAGRSSRPDFQAIVALHWRIHAVASGILKLKAKERGAEALEQLAELSILLDKLFDRLKVFRPRG